MKCLSLKHIDIPTRAEVLAREQWNYTLSEVGRVIDYKENVALK